MPIYRTHPTGGSRMYNGARFLISAPSKAAASRIAREYGLALKMNDINGPYGRSPALSDELIAEAEQVFAESGASVLGSVWVFGEGHQYWKPITDPDWSLRDDRSQDAAPNEYKQGYTDGFRDASSEAIDWNLDDEPGYAMADVDRGDQTYFVSVGESEWSIATWSEVEHIVGQGNCDGLEDGKAQAEQWLSQYA